MSALTPEQVDAALMLRELAGEPVPVTPKARELWVRYDIQPGPIDHQMNELELKELWVRMEQLNPRADDENEDEYRRRISPLFTETANLINVFRISGHIQSLTSQRLYLSTSTQQRDGYDEFNFKLSAAEGYWPLLSIGIRRLTTAEPKLESLKFESRYAQVSFDSADFDSPAYQELAHLIAPQIRRALELAPQALAMLDMEAPQ